MGLIHLFGATVLFENVTNSFLVKFFTSSVTHFFSNSFLLFGRNCSVVFLRELLKFSQISFTVPFLFFEYKYLFNFFIVSGDRLVVLILWELYWLTFFSFVFILMSILIFDITGWWSGMCKEFLCALISSIKALNFWLTRMLSNTCPPDEFFYEEIMCLWVLSHGWCKIPETFHHCCCECRDCELHEAL